MTRETWVQSQVESYKRLKKWYLTPPCLTLSIIRYGSRVKWSNPGKEVAPFPTPWCSSYRKGSLLVALDCSHQLYYYFTYMIEITYFYHICNFLSYQLSDNSPASAFVTVLWCCPKKPVANELRQRSGALLVPSKRARTSRTQFLANTMSVILRTGAVVNQRRCHKTSACRQNDLQS